MENVRDEDPASTLVGIRGLERGGGLGTIVRVAEDDPRDVDHLLDHIGRIEALGEQHTSRTVRRRWRTRPTLAA